MKVGDIIKVIGNQSGNYKTNKAKVVEICSDGDVEYKDLTGEREYTKYVYKQYIKEDIELLNKELKDVEFGDMITDGEEFVYIFGRVDDIIFTGYMQESEKEASETDPLTYSLPEFLRKFSNFEFVGGESDYVDITVDGKTTTISRKSAEALNLI